MFHCSGSSFESDSVKPSMAGYRLVDQVDKRRSRTLTMLTGTGTKTRHTG
jgi:hypothetical protein